MQDRIWRLFVQSAGNLDSCIQRTHNPLIYAKSIRSSPMHAIVVVLVRPQRLRHDEVQLPDLKRRMPSQSPS